MTDTQQAAMEQALEALTVDKLYNSIAHGDEDHRAWLRVAIVNAFAGLPPPPFEKPAEVPPLTDEQIESVNNVWVNQLDYEVFEIHQPSVFEFARAIEQLVRKKAGLV